MIVILLKNHGIFVALLNAFRDMKSYAILAGEYFNG